MTGGGGAGKLRWEQRLETFGRALARLTDACGREPYDALARAGLTRYDDLVRAGLIQTFMFCFEMSWKVLKDLLFHDGHDVKAPRAVIRKSFDMDYIDESDCETLLSALDKRNLMSHAYGGDTALEAEALIEDQYHPVLLRLHRNLEARRNR